MPDSALIERAKTMEFVLQWYNWQSRYRDALSQQSHFGYGYRAGVFYPHGAQYGQHHDDFPPFFDAMAVLGLSLISIDALFCYEKYSSCAVCIDTLGSNFPFP